MKAKFPYLAASHSMASFFFLVLCAIAFTAGAEDGVKYHWDAIVQYPQAPSPSTVVEGNARFQILTPTPHPNGVFPQCPVCR